MDWFSVKPAIDGEDFARRLTAMVGESAGRPVSRAMEQGARGDDFYEIKNQEATVSAAVTALYDGQWMGQIGPWLSQFSVEGSVLDVGCDNGLLTERMATLWPGAKIWGMDRCVQALACARTLCQVPTVQFCGEKPQEPFSWVVSLRTLHENFDQAGVCNLESLPQTARRLADSMASHAQLLTCGDHQNLLSAERCGADGVLLGWLLALDRCGFFPTCHARIVTQECGREAEFHALHLQRGKSRGEGAVLQWFCQEVLGLLELPDQLQGAAAEAALWNYGGQCHYGFSLAAPDGTQMGRSGVWQSKAPGGKILLFQASTQGSYLRVWPQKQLETALAGLRGSAQQARAAGYLVQEGLA